MENKIHKRTRHNIGETRLKFISHIRIVVSHTSLKPNTGQEKNEMVDGYGDTWVPRNRMFDIGSLPQRPCTHLIENWNLRCYRIQTPLLFGHFEGFDSVI